MRFVQKAAWCFLFWQTSLPNAWSQEFDFSNVPLSQAIDIVSDHNNVTIVYSSSLVNPSYRVPNGTTGDKSIAALEGILNDFDLSVARNRNVFYVVQSQQTGATGNAGSLFVLIKDDTNLNRIERATVVIKETGAVAEYVGNGVYQFSDLNPGKYILAATVPDYEPAQKTVTLTSGQFSFEPMTVVPENLTRLEDIIVNTSRYNVVDRTGPSLTTFDQSLMERSPNLTADPVRVTQRLPGVASGGLSAKVHVRGGEANETLLVFDGVELNDPFHLRDFQSVFSVIDQRVLADVDVYTGGFPASFGDKLSSVVNMNSFEPFETRHELSLSFFDTSFLSSGIFGRADGEWIVSLRRGNLDWVIDVVDDSLGEPDYVDGFGHVEYRFSDSVRLSFNALLADDSVVVVTEPTPEELERARGETRNHHVWLALENDWSGDLSSRTIVSYSRVDNDRIGISNDEEGVVGTVSDKRDLQETTIKQDWTFRPAAKHQTSWGFQIKSVRANYTYRSQAEFFDLLAELDGRSDVLTRQSVLDVSGTDFGLYALDRWSLNSRWALEVGLRWDRQTYIADSTQVSPRLNVLYQPSEKHQFRLSLGRFFQSQAINELQVEDGVEEFFPAQRANHLILGYDYSPGENTTLRIEAYRKELSRLRPRFENLFDPLALLPELASDRIRVDPDSATVEGVELRIDHKPPSGWGWWFGYVYSIAQDRFGSSKVVRNWDQRHALTSGFSFDGSNWDVTLSANYRSGWPTTGIDLQVDDEGDPIAVLGPRNAERFGDFGSVDLHVSRSFDLRSGGTLVVFLDVLNLLDRENPCCVEYDFDDEEGVLEREIEHWLPLIPSLGVRWEF